MASGLSISATLPGESKVTNIVNVVADGSTVYISYIDSTGALKIAKQFISNAGYTNNTATIATGATQN